METIVTDKSESKTIIKDLMAWAVIAGYVVCGLFVLNQYAEHISAFKLLFSFIGVLALVPLLTLTSHGKKGYRFLLASWVEVNQVVWPEKQEATRLTCVVVVSVFTVSLLLWFIDSIIASIFRQFILG